jgi:hypothetical protein
MKNILKAIAEWIRSHKRCEEAEEINHTCGSCPDPFWTDEDFKRKSEAQKDCLKCKA